MENKNPIWSRLWFMWIILTIAYLGLYWLALNGTVPNTIAYAVGLFVPFGFWNGFMGASSILEAAGGSVPAMTAAIGAIVALIVVIFGDRVVQKLIGQSPAIKFFVNLVILLLLTLVVDFAIWQKWASWILVTGGSID